MHRPRALSLLDIARFIAVGAGRLEGQLATPPGWRWVLDSPARLVTSQTVPDSAWRFVAMPPGWHLTTGPGAFVYHPAYEGQGVKLTRLVWM